MRRNARKITVKKLFIFYSLNKKIKLI